jgi:hypothetical protein
MATDLVPPLSISVEFLSDGETPTVSSLDVAHHFGKKHKHVLDEIAKLLDCSEGSVKNYPRDARALGLAEAFTPAIKGAQS